MKRGSVTLAFGVGAVAQQCSYTLTAKGPASGTIGQLSDGQIRIGGGYVISNFYTVNGYMKDAANRGCIVTPPTSQIQCDQGVPGNSADSIVSEIVG